MASNIDQTDTFDSPKRGLESRTKYLLWCLDRIQQIAYHSARSRLLYFLASKLNKDESLMKNLICILFFFRSFKKAVKESTYFSEAYFGMTKERQRLICVGESLSIAFVCSSKDLKLELFQGQIIK